MIGKIAFMLVPVSSLSMASLSRARSVSFPASDYPYPNLVNVSNFVNIVLDYDNYLLWEDQVPNLIDSHNFRSFINGKIVVHVKIVNVTFPDGYVKEIDNSDYVSWQRSDKVLKGWITSTLSKEILYYIVGLEISFDL